MLWGGILLVDHFGPTKDVAAHITDVDVTHSRKGGTTYSIEGIDNHGGEFDTDVTESIYDRADRGDSVVVSRAWLTGRVVAIDGGGWRHDGGRMVWLYGIAFVVGLVLLICGLVSMFRFAAAAEGNPRPLRRVRWWLIAVLVVAAGWIVYERNEANAGSGGTSSSDGASSDTASSESGTDNTLAPTATLLFGPGSVQCSTLIGVVPLMVSTLTIDDVVTPTEIDEALATMSSVTSDCASDSIQEALCAELQRAKAADSTLNVTTSGRCPGLP